MTESTRLSKIVPAAISADEVRARPRWMTWVTALGVLALLTVPLLASREQLDKVHIALVYLLIVLGGSAAGGRSVGVVLSFLSFFSFNFLFLQPYYTFHLAEPLDWLVLLSFLVTGLVAAELLYRAQREAALARRRAAEVDRLATLGAETLSAARADSALAAIAGVIQSTLGADGCDVYTWQEGVTRLALAVQSEHASGSASSDEAVPDIVSWVAANGRGAWEFSDGTTRVAPTDLVVPAITSDKNVRALVIPLSVRGRTVGVLRLFSDPLLLLDPAHQRYLEALSYYAALGVERVRLTAEAERVEELRAADRLKDSLLATVSHDLRRPLTTIRGLAHEIADDGDERALVIEEEVIRLTRFVADILDMSRLKAGAIQTNAILNAAEDVMGAVLQRVAGTANARKIHAALDPGEPVLVGRFDFAHTLRILSNLLENAIRYSAEGTAIDFTVRREDDLLAFAVADRGPGIPETERERIFGSFYRPVGARQDVGGAGLGLAIARGLAEAQQGSLDYTPRPGGGSVFTLRVPAANLSATLLE